MGRFKNFIEEMNDQGMVLYSGLDSEFKGFRTEKRLPWLYGMWFVDNEKSKILDYYGTRGVEDLLKVKFKFNKPVLDMTMYDTDDVIEEYEAVEFLRDVGYVGDEDDLLLSVFIPERSEVTISNLANQMFMFSEESFHEISEDYSAMKIMEDGEMTYFVFNPNDEDYGIIK